MDISVLKGYSFESRKDAQKTAAAEQLFESDLDPEAVLLIGFGGTISSGYSPTNETIVPLFPSPAIKQIEYINLFGTSNLAYQNIDLLAKDSRDITIEDVELLLDVLHVATNKKVLITAGTYMLPKIALAIQQNCSKTIEKVVTLTGSILPAGFVASDADANIWSALTILNHEVQEDHSGLLTMLVFHGRVYKTEEDFASVDLHPQQMKNLVIQYPLTTVPTDNIL